MTRVFDFLGTDGFGAYEIDFKSGSAQRVMGSPGAMLVPGFVDIHIHGGFGIDFMSASLDEMRQLCIRLAAEGYEYFLPTTVTASPAEVSRAISIIPETSMIPGFHLEGPFISPKFPGAQPPGAIATPPEGDSDWDPILNDPRLRVITLAPEIPRALQLAARLMTRGVVVSMGHTNATFDEARFGFEFGVSHSTHTFNAMRPLHHREAAAVGYALLNDAMASELIYDRLHVCREAAALLLKCKPPEKLIAVSDGTMAGGFEPGRRLTMWGLECLVGRKEVRLLDGTLAGSGITLFDAFRNLAEDFGPEIAIRACSLNARKSLRLPEPSVYLELDRALNLVKRHENLILRG
jgi:N-acetylglucosamine-6-phosphate deacetylase